MCAVPILRPLHFSLANPAVPPMQLLLVASSIDIDTALDPLTTIIDPTLLLLVIL